MRNAVLITLLALPLRAQEPAAWDVASLAREAQAKSPAAASAALELESLRALRRQAGFLDNPVLEYLHHGGDNLSLSQRLEPPSRRGARLSTYDRRVEEAEAELAIARLEAAAAARAACYDLFLARQKAELLRGELESFDRVRVEAPQRYQAGLKNQLGSLRMDLEAAKNRSLLVQAQLEAADALQTLRNLLGLSADAPLEVAEGPEPPAEPLELSVLRSRLPASPYLRRAQARVQALDAQALFERRQRLPDFDLKLDYDSADHAAGAGFTLALPFWDRRSAAVRSAEALSGQARVQLDARTRESEGALREAFRRYDAARQIAQAYQSRLLERARSAQATALLSYREGQVSLTDYLDTTRAAREAVLEYRQALHDLRASKSELDRILGD